MIIISSKFIQYNASPYNLNIPDCSVRSLARFLHVPYFYALSLLMYSQSKTKAKTYNKTVNIRYLLETILACEEWEFDSTVNRLVPLDKDEIYIFVKDHALYAKDGKFYDTWDSGRKYVESYFKTTVETFRNLDTLLDEMEGFETYEDF